MQRLNADSLLRHAGLDVGVWAGTQATSPWSRRNDLMDGLSWLRAGYDMARAKSIEEVLRLKLLRRYRSDERVSLRLTEVMKLGPDEVEQTITAADPRSVPSNPVFVASGWSDHMLLRYLLALDECADARVLDSCCGLGWGSYLAASLSSNVTGVDLDRASVAFCAPRWGSPNLSFRVASVLDLPFENESFDVVLCMDAIEHFSLVDGQRYISELKPVCRPGGHLFGSSAFLETRWGATRLRRTNRHHLYIYTRGEMEHLLRACFGQPRLLTRHYFQAIRR